VCLPLETRASFPELNEAKTKIYADNNSRLNNHKAGRLYFNHIIKIFHCSDRIVLNKANDRERNQQKLNA